MLIVSVQVAIAATERQTFATFCGKEAFFRNSSDF